MRGVGGRVFCCGGGGVNGAPQNWGGGGQGSIDRTINHLLWTLALKVPKFTVVSRSNTSLGRESFVGMSAGSARACSPTAFITRCPLAPHVCGSPVPPKVHRCLLPCALLPGPGGPAGLRLLRALRTGHWAPRVCAVWPGHRWPRLAHTGPIVRGLRAEGGGQIRERVPLGSVVWVHICALSGRSGPSVRRGHICPDGFQRKDESHTDIVYRNPFLRPRTLGTTALTSGALQPSPPPPPPLNIGPHWGCWCTDTVRD